MQSKRPILRSNVDITIHLSEIRDMTGKKGQEGATTQSLFAINLVLSRPQQFTKSDRTTLQGAAEILKIPLETLLAVAETSRLWTSHYSSNETDSIETLAEKPGDESVDEISAETTAEPFAYRAQRKIRSNNVNEMGPSRTTYSDPSISTILPWLNDSSAPVTQAVTSSSDTDFDSYLDNWDLNINAHNLESRPNQSANVLTSAFVNDADVGLPLVPTPQPSNLKLFHMGSGIAGNSSLIAGDYNQPAGGVSDPELSLATSHNGNDSNVPLAPVHNSAVQSQQESQPAIRQSGTKRKQRGPFKNLAQRQETSVTRSLKACIRCNGQRIRDVGGAYWNLEVRKFIPVQSDALERRWKINGVEQTFRCEQYAIADMKKAGRTLKCFVNKTIGQAICYYIDETDKLLRSTYLMAYRYSILAEREEDRIILYSVLRLWNASRMACRPERICGDETLGMQPQDFGPRSPNSGHVLLPPVMTAQLEVILVVTVLLPTQKELLTRLKNLVQENNRRSWFVIYLSMFVLLHNCALLTAGDGKKAQKQGLPSEHLERSAARDNAASTNLGFSNSDLDIFGIPHANTVDSGNIENVTFPPFTLPETDLHSSLLELANEDFDDLFGLFNSPCLSALPQEGPLEVSNTTHVIETDNRNHNDMGTLSSDSSWINITPPSEQASSPKQRLNSADPVKDSQDVFGPKTFGPNSRGPRIRSRVSQNTHFRLRVNHGEHMLNIYRDQDPKTWNELLKRIASHSVHMTESLVVRSRISRTEIILL
ncbi:MAG: hypothetical protein Q9167_007257 [Letrouitia subvulpina]